MIAINQTEWGLFIDDIRDPPAKGRWHVARDSATAIEILESYRYNYTQLAIVSFDHDLGNDDTTRPVVLWMCEHEFWPVKATVHSSNPVGIEWLEGMIRRYAPKGTLIR